MGKQGDRVSRDLQTLIITKYLFVQTQVENDLLGTNHDFRQVKNVTAVMMKGSTSGKNEGKESASDAQQEDDLRTEKEFVA